MNNVSKTPSDNSVFHCSVSGCIYADGTERYFTSKKLLKQHYTKVHAEKKFLCEKCKKGFGADWMRKHHEATCGTDWSCSCGNQYTSWESLITHTRRTQHAMPSHFRQRKKKCKTSQSQQIVLPLVIVMYSGMPVITQLQRPQPTHTQPQLLPFGNNIKQRKILPKHVAPIIKNYINASDSITENTKSHLPSVCTTGTQTNPGCYDIATWTSIDDDSFDQNSLLCKTLSSSNTSTADLMMNTGLSSNSSTQMNEKTVAETQTSENYIFKDIQIVDQSSVQKESRASQCSRRELTQKPEVCIESTYTQTTESTVIRMKKASFRRPHSGARNRRKSDARNLDTNSNQSHLYWSNMKISLGNTRRGQICFPLCSSSTQTAPRAVEKTVCDSETLTDHGFIPSLWQEPANTFSSPTQTSDLFQYVESTSNFNAKDVPSPDLSLNMLGSSIHSFDQQTLPFHLDAIASSDTRDINCNSSQHLFNVETQTDVDLHSNLLDDAIVQTDLYPLLSHTQTQTALGSDYYTNILANMETQTTEEFLFSDLEFSDIETQTPWNDLSSFDDESDILLLNHDNESSTNHYGLLDSDQPVLTIFQDTETQTIQQLSDIELTNSYAQTLDLNLSNAVF